MPVGAQALPRGAGVLVARVLVAVVFVILSALLLPAAPAHADAVRDQQWHLGFLRAREAWKYSTGRGITVAVIDSGVDASHPDLQGQVLPGADFVDGSTDGRVDLVGHGTTVAALIAGRNDDDGVIGLAYDAKILPIRVLDEENRYESGEVVARAVIWAVDRGAQVINLSLGSAEAAGALTEAIQYAFERDVVVIACDGNLSNKRGTNVWHPAREPGVVAVSGVTSEGTFWDGSLQGPATVLAAPAANITGANPGGDYWNVQGTSFASPIVAASAALLRARFPTMSSANVINRLVTTAWDFGAPGRDSEFGFGIVNPARALTASTPSVRRNPLVGAGAAGSRGQNAGSGPDEPGAPGADNPQALAPGAGTPWLPRSAFVIGGIAAIALALLTMAMAASGNARRRRGGHIRVLEPLPAGRSARSATVSPASPGSHRSKHRRHGNGLFGGKKQLRPDELRPRPPRAAMWPKPAAATAPDVETPRTAPSAPEATKPRGNANGTLFGAPNGPRHGAGSVPTPPPTGTDRPSASGTTPPPPESTPPTATPADGASDQAGRTSTPRPAESTPAPEHATNPPRRAAEGKHVKPGPDSLASWLNDVQDLARFAEAAGAPPVDTGFDGQVALDLPDGDAARRGAEQGESSSEETPASASQTQAEPDAASPGVPDAAPAGSDAAAPEAAVTDAAAAPPSAVPPSAPSPTAAASTAAPRPEAPFADWPAETVRGDGSVADAPRAENSPAGGDALSADVGADASVADEAESASEGAASTGPLGADAVGSFFDDLPRLSDYSAATEATPPEPTPLESTATESTATEADSTQSPSTEAAVEQSSEQDADAEVSAILREILDNVQRKAAPPRARVQDRQQPPVSAEATGRDAEVEPRLAPPLLPPKSRGEKRPSPRPAPAADPMARPASTPAGRSDATSTDATSTDLTGTHATSTDLTGTEAIGTDLTGTEAIGTDAIGDGGADPGHGRVRRTTRALRAGLRWLRPTSSGDTAAGRE